MATTDTTIVLTAVDKTAAGIASVKRGLGGLESTAVATARSLASIGAGVSVAGLAAFVKSSIDAADALNDLSVRTGLSVEALNGLQYAAKLGDTNMEALGAGVGRLNKAIGEAASGNDKMAETLSSLGITARVPEPA